MKRWLLSVALLLAGVAGFGHANYIVLIVNVGGSPDNDSSAQAVAGAAGGAVSGVAGPGAPGMGAFTSTGNEYEESQLYVATAVELRRAKNKPPLILPHPSEKGVTVAARAYDILKWKGMTYLADQYIDPNIVVIWPTKAIPTVDDRFRDEKQKVKPGASVETYVKLAEWALNHGKIAEVPAIMEDAAKTDPKHPVVVAFKKVEADLKRKVSKADNAESWRAMLGGKLGSSDHYAVIFDAPVDSPPEVHRRADLLERTMRGFYYWFAIHGKTLPVPDRRLITVLVDTPEEFKRKHMAFDSQPTVADGFFSQRDDVAVFSALPVDEGYEALNKITNSMWQGAFKFDDLLKGKGMTRIDRAPKDTAVSQTLALVKKSLQIDSEVASVTHEGVRQLITASGLLPRTVIAPEWLQFGMASFFETPKESPWEGMGAPSWLYLREFQDWEAKKKLEAPDLALMRVITDAYFNEAKIIAPALQKEAWLKARTMAWSLTYYLAQRRLDGILKYYQELANMPRDIEIDPRILLEVFARSFDLTDPQQRPDPVKMQNLAREWFQHIRFISPEVNFQVKEQLARIAENVRKNRETNKKVREVLGAGGVQPGGVPGRGAGGAGGAGGIPTAGD